MRSPVPRRPALPLLAAMLLAGCDDPSSARATTVVRLCLDAAFVAFRNDGAGWVRALPVAARTYELAATPRVALALVSGDPSHPYQQVEFLSAAEAVFVHPCGIAPPPAVPPADAVAGVVRGWTGAGSVQVAYGTAWRQVFGADSTFGLPAIAGTSDLLATRWSASAPTQRAQAMIVRRGQAYAAGTTVTLDFSGPEAFAPEPRTLRTVVRRTFTTSTLLTAAGQEMRLSETLAGDPGEGPAPRDLPIAMVAAARLAPGDLHRVSVGEEWRSAELWARAPREFLTELGPALAVPTVTAVASSPQRRMRVTLPVQAEYGGSVLVSLHQADRSAAMLATRAHFGGRAATWTLEVPDLSALEGFPARAGLRDEAMGWGITASSRPIPAFLGGARPRDGDVHLSTSASGEAP